VLAFLPEFDALLLRDSIIHLSSHRKRTVRFVDPHPQPEIQMATPARFELSFLDFLVKD
jgi:hypothetical protein